MDKDLATFSSGPNNHLGRYEIKMSETTEHVLNIFKYI